MLTTDAVLQNLVSGAVFFVIIRDILAASLANVHLIILGVILSW